MIKKSKKLFTIVLAVFLALIFLGLYTSDFRIIKFWFGLPLGGEDIPGWKMQMTDEQLKEHLGEERYNKMKEARKKATEKDSSEDR